MTFSQKSDIINPKHDCQNKKNSRKRPQKQNYIKQTTGKETVMGWILICEDEQAIADQLGNQLERKGFKVIKAKEYNEARELINQSIESNKQKKAGSAEKSVGNACPLINSNGENSINTTDPIDTIDVMICDLNIKPIQKRGIDAVGFSILAEMKEKSPNTYRIIYTGNDLRTVLARCVGLGDVYFQKTNRSGQMNENRATVGELAEYVERYVRFKQKNVYYYAAGIIYNETLETVSIGGKTVSLETYEFEVLGLLVKNKNQYITLKELGDVILKAKPCPIFSSENQHIIKCMQQLSNKIGKGYINYSKEMGFILMSTYA